MESKPDIWFREAFYELIDIAREETATAVNVTSDNLVLLENASAAVNGIFRSLDLVEGEIFIYFSTAYGMVKHTAQWLMETRGIRIIEIPVILPIVDDEFSYCEPLRSTLNGLTPTEKAKVRIVTFSHLSSVPAFLEPIKLLTNIVKDSNPNSLVLVDGAHALGQIPIDIPSLGPIDYYLSNAHKWLYAPKGSCFLWTNPKNINALHPQPTVISSENDVLTEGGMPYLRRFAYTGTKDFTGYISISDAFKFREMLGGDEVINGYTHELARSAGDYLVGLWGTGRLSPQSYEANLFNIVLPTSSLTKAVDCVEKLYETEGIYMLALKDELSGIVYSRFSSQIYLEMSDFVRVGELVKRELMD